MSSELSIHLPKPLRDVCMEGEPMRDEAVQRKEEKLREKERELNRALENARSRGQELQEQVGRVETLADELRRAKNDALRNNEEELVNLSLQIAEKVVGHEVENGRHRIERIVEAALDAAPTEEEARVHLNPEECGPVREALTDEDGAVGAGVSITADPDVPRGSCRVETPGGSVVSGVQSRLEKIEDNLLNKPKE